jgi:hypothetical protein
LDFALDDLSLADDSCEQQALAGASLAMYHAVNSQQTGCWISVVILPQRPSEKLQVQTS